MKTEGGAVFINIRFPGMNKFLKKYRNNKKIKYFTIGILFIIIVVLFTVVENGTGDRKRAKKLEKAAENEIVSIKKKIPKMDRNTFITVDNKVVVGFISLPNKQIKYPVINTFNDNTNTYSLCRSGDKMPWDLEGMTIYGIDSFTRVLEDIESGEKLEFEDVTGKKYQYKYEKNIKKKVVDYGIKICSVDKEGEVNKEYWFVKK